MKNAVKLVVFIFVVALIVLSALRLGAKFSSSASQVKSIEMITASWYGPRFHGRKTASGRVFDMREISAAHRSLPFGTKILLVNPTNNAQVIVSITDRGPYVAGRDLDLSLGAAEALGIKKQGLAQLYAVITD